MSPANWILISIGSGSGSGVGSRLGLGVGVGVSVASSQKGAGVFAEIPVQAGRSSNSRSVSGISRRFNTFILLVLFQVVSDGACFACGRVSFVPDKRNQKLA